MSKKVYALLVGIDAYAEPVRALEGCKNDIRHLAEFLRVRLGDSSQVVTLLDEAASREAVVAAFGSHLGRAGAGDVALFAYAGHGSQELPPAPLATSESTGRLQNLMLHDAGRTVDGTLRWPLADKELRHLLESVAASGAHTVAVLDCCHAGDVTRDARGSLRQWLPEQEMSNDRDARAMIEVLKGPRPLEEFIDGAISGAQGRDELRHVALYACQSKQSASEDVFGGEHRGVFSASLLDVLATINSEATYRDVLAAVRDRVQRDFPSQRPDLFPETSGGVGDARFLDGTVQVGPPSISMTRAGTIWSIDAGSMHGLSEPVDEREFRLACATPDGVIRGEARVVRVQPASAVVEPIDWQPDQPVYRAVIVKAPSPLAGVEFVAVADPAAAAAYQCVRDRMATSGPQGGTSVFVAEESGGVSRAGVVLRVRYDGADPAGPSLRVERADGTAAVPAAGSTVPCQDAAEAAATVVTQLEHIARWERIRTLGTHRSALADEVTISVYPGRGVDEGELPADRPPLPFVGEYVFDGEPGSVVYFWVRVTKRTPRSDLYLALLDLDDKLACQVLQESTPLIAEIWNQQLSFTVPEEGTETHDWFKFIVSEFDFRAAAFTLPPITEPAPPADRSVDDLVDAPADSTRGASIVGAPTGPDSCAITVPFTVRGATRNP